MKAKHHFLIVDIIDIIVLKRASMLPELVMQAANRVPKTGVAYEDNSVPFLQYKTSPLKRFYFKFFKYLK